MSESGGVRVWGGLPLALVWTRAPTRLWRVEGWRHVDARVGRPPEVPELLTPLPLAMTVRLEPLHPERGLGTYSVLLPARWKPLFDSLSQALFHRYECSRPAVPALQLLQALLQVLPPSQAAVIASAGPLACAVALDRLGNLPPHLRNLLGTPRVGDWP